MQVLDTEDLNLILKFISSSLVSEHRFVYKTAPNKFVIEEKISRYRSLLLSENESNFVYYKVVQKQVSELIIAQKQGERIAVFDFYLQRETPVKIKLLFKKMREYFFNFSHFDFKYISIRHENLFRSLIKISKHEKSTYLLGNVKRSIKRLEAKVANDRYDFVKFNYKAHIKSVLEIEENSSKELREIYQKMCLENDVFIVKNKDTVLGVIAIHKDTITRNAHIVRIAMAKQYRRRGLSKLLYLNALRYLNSKNIVFYTGRTQSKIVQNLGHQMGRKVYAKRLSLLC